MIEFPNLACSRSAQFNSQQPHDGHIIKLPMIELKLNAAPLLKAQFLFVHDVNSFISYFWVSVPKSCKYTSV